MRILPPKTSCVILLAAELIHLAGCVAFQSSLTDPVKRFPKTAAKRDVCVDIMSIKVTPDGYWMYPSGQEALKRYEEKICTKRMKRSRLFGSVSSEPNQNGITVQIWKVQGAAGCDDLPHMDPQAAEAAFIFWVCTLCLLPLSEDYSVRLTAIVTDNRTGQQTIIKLRDGMQNYITLLALPLMPFKWAAIEEAKLRHKLYDNLCLEIYRSGMLNAAP
jgi:hypothetical protein